MNDDLHLLVGAYAVDALEGSERAAFEEHLASCAACAEELADLQDAAAALGSVAALAPPPQLRTRVLDAASQARQEPAQTASVVPLQRRRRHPLAWVAGAAAAVVMLVAGGATWRAISVEQELSLLRAQAADVTAVLAAPDARTESAAVAGGGRGAVVVAPSQERGVFVGTSLPAPAPDRTYQLWLLDAAGRATSVGLFRPTGDGDATVALPPGVLDAATVGLTVEPSGGSRAPTTEPVLALPVRL